MLLSEAAFQKDVIQATCDEKKLKRNFYTMHNLFYYILIISFVHMIIKYLI